MSPIAPTLQSFFTDRLAQQRRVSPRTIASYRDSLCGSPEIVEAFLCRFRLGFGFPDLVVDG